MDEAPSETEGLTELKQSNQVFWQTNKLWLNVRDMVAEKSNLTGTYIQKPISGLVLHRQIFVPSKTETPGLPYTLPERA